jgi:hypothetical protein
MPTVLLDGEDFSTDITPDTWAGLLELVDRHIESGGHIVTGVRFDGLDEPAFREPLALDQPLAELATVEISTGTPASLLERCVAEAVSSIGSLCAGAVAVGEHFRIFELEKGNAGLVELADGVSTLIALGGALALATRAEGLDGAPQRERLDGVVAELTGHVESLLTAQQSGDWITVADILQYDVEPALRRWETVLGGFSIGVAAA